MLTEEVKRQIAHYEKNMLNLEDTSDYDSSDSTEDVSLSLNDIELGAIGGG